MKSLNKYLKENLFFESKAPKEIKNKLSEITNIINNLCGELLIKLGEQQSNGKYDLFLAQKYKTQGNYGASWYEIEFELNDKNLNDFDNLLNNDTFDIKFKEYRDKNLRISTKLYGVNGYNNLKKACELQDLLIDLSNVYDSKDANKIKYNGADKDLDKNYRLELHDCDVPEKFIQDFYQNENFCKNLNYINMVKCNIDTKNVEFFTDINKVFNNKRITPILNIRYSDIESIKNFNDKHAPKKLDLSNKLGNEFIEEWYEWSNDDLKGVALGSDPNAMNLYFVKSDKKFFTLVLWQNNKGKDFCNNLGCRQRYH